MIGVGKGGMLRPLIILAKMPAVVSASKQNKRSLCVKQKTGEPSLESLGAHRSGCEAAVLRGSCKAECVAYPQSAITVVSISCKLSIAPITFASWASIKLAAAK